MSERFDDRVVFETQGPVAIISLDRPERLNAFDAAMYRGVNKALEAFRDNDSLWVAIIQGNGERAFCAGADVSALNDNAKQGVMKALGGLLLDDGMVTDKPIIAAVHGHCVGEGVNLILGCDLVLADRSSSFMVSEAKVGTNAVDIPIKLGKKIGYNKTFAMLSPGDGKSADWCQRAGLVETVTEDGTVKQQALAFALDLCERGAPLAIRAQKETLWRSVFEDETIARERGLVLRDQMRRSKDYAEGRTAFLEKRKPRFIGE